MKIKRCCSLPVGILCVILGALTSGHTVAQEAVVAASGEASGVGGSSGFTVGQTVFHTVLSTGGIITEGVQQPYEILFMTGKDDDPSVSVDMTVYPNPAGSEIRLRVDRIVYDELTCRLSDSKGQSIWEGQVLEKETCIPAGHLPAGTYILILSEKGRVAATWKVIKK